MTIKYKITKKFNKEVINEITQISNTKGLTAESLLEQAKNKKSKLNSFFEWDDSKAGDKYRLQQARFIINEVKVYVEDKTIFTEEDIEIEVNGFENISEIDEDGELKRVYKTHTEIISTEDYRRQIITRALKQQKYWAEQHEIYSELKPIVSAINKTEKEVKEKWQKKK